MSKVSLHNVRAILTNPKPSYQREYPPKGKHREPYETAYRPGDARCLPLKRTLVYERRLLLQLPLEYHDSGLTGGIAHDYIVRWCKRNKIKLLEVVPCEVQYKNGRICIAAAFVFKNRKSAIRFAMSWQ